MTLNEIAAEMNGLFRKYGLDHDVVRVSQGTYNPELVFIKGKDPAVMELLLTTLAFVFDGFFEVHPSTGQGRLF